MGKQDLSKAPAFYSLRRATPCAGTACPLMASLKRQDGGQALSEHGGPGAGGCFPAPLLAPAASRQQL
jgi:hypothetical protein